MYRSKVKNMKNGLNVMTDVVNVREGRPAG